MVRKLLPQAVATLKGRRRTGIVVSLPVVLAGIVLAATAGSAGTPARGTGAGIVRAGSSVANGTGVSAGNTSASFGPNVVNGVFQGESPAVSTLPVLPVIPGPLHTRDNESLQAGGNTNAHDPVVQHRKGTGPISAPIQSFDGICLPFGPPCGQPSSCSCLPPDTDGEVGGSQYVQAVNTDFAVYSKTGAVLRTSTPINELWANTNGECKIHNDGDPVVVYDQIARRWLISQFIATPTGEPGDDQYGECIAVSTTSDATGSYYLYEFDFGTDVFFDYPKIGVWPDGYYMMANEFPTNSETSAGVGVFAFERSKMLLGQPARVVFFDESQHNPTGGQYIGMLPGDLDGSSLPAAGSPNWFAEVDDPTGIPPQSVGDTGFDLRMWAFHVDWTNPANSTFGNNGAPNTTQQVAQFVRPQCVYGYGDCAPQKGGPQQLDVLGDRLMFRMPYRKLEQQHRLDPAEPLGADARRQDRDQVVRGAGSARRLAVDLPAGDVRAGRHDDQPALALDGQHRQDKNGDIALGYSASGPNDYPSIRYTGRAAGDPLNQMTQVEQVGFTGTGPQTEVEGSVGRLQRPHRRPGRRLHLLVHAGVPRRGHDHHRDLAHAHRLVQVPRVQIDTACR